MSLQTYEDEEILARVRRIEQHLEALARVCREILADVKRPTYPATDGIAVTPKRHRHR